MEKTAIVTGTKFEHRARVIRRHCKDGTGILLKRGPKNRHDKNAISKDYSILSPSISTIERAIFLHELTHVYQQRTWGGSDNRVGLEQIKANSDYCYGPLVAGKPFHEYNQEEQAEMVSDRYLLNNGFPHRFSCNQSVSLQQLNGIIVL
jgi:hypothetical protein